MADGEPTLLELFEDRFEAVPEAERLDHVGLLAAQTWALGAEGMREAGFLLPPALHAELADDATWVASREHGGEHFLDRIREEMRFDDFFVAFLQSLFVHTQGGARDDDPTPERGTPFATLELGEVFDGYRIEALIGEGGMGRVYRGEQLSLSRPVAIKVLHVRHAEDPAFVARFAQEAQAAAKLVHPNVVRVYQAGQNAERGLHYIVFEFVPGPSLEQVLEERTRLPEAEALAVARDVAAALVSAEEHGYVHRDVKPANVLLGEEGAKLSDLGLVREVEQGTRMTTAGLVMGTPHYMAPEQALDEITLDVRADLYSLGLTLFHMITGRLPFKGRTAVAVISQHVNRSVPAARGFDPEVEVSPAASALIGFLAARQRDHRYASAREALESIERVLSGEQPLRPEGFPRGDEEITAPAAPQPAAGPPASSRYYTKEGKLLTGGQPTPSPEDDATRPGLERMSLDEEWATLARSHLLESTEPPPPPPSPTPTRAERSQLLLSDDTQRAYRIKRRLGQGTQGIVYEVEVLGRQDFPAFLRPVERAVIKRAKEAAAVNAERLIYSQIDYRVVKLLDHGLDSKERPYLVLERLRATPHERYRGPEGRGRIPVDPASAVELFVNLLDRVKGLHFRRKLPLVLCDIKPANVMLRMPSAEPLDDEAYLTRLAEGRYEPVFVDLGCAQHREVLREAQGRLRGLIGSPMFLPPESIPRPGAEGELIPGIYGPQTDVYALTLTFYEWISGVRAYQHLEHEWKNDEDPLLALFELKHRGADPVDAATLTGRVGSNAQPVLEILRAGLHPDPRQRATTNKLFELASKAFQLQVWKRDKRPYAFDDAQNHLTWRQGLFPRLSLERNGYKRATVVEA